MSSVTVTAEPSLAQSKADIDVARANSPHGGSSTMWVIAVLAIILIVIFIVFMILFVVWIGNHPATHDIILTNNTTIPISVLLGADTEDGLSVFPPLTLVPGASQAYTSTPGVSIQVAGLTSGQTAGLEDSAFTFGVLRLAGQDYDGILEVSNGNQIITDLTRYRNNQDVYGVSLQRGYNLQMSITPISNVVPEVNDSFSCTTPRWSHTITGTGSNACPEMLQETDTGNNYQGCFSPCDVYGNTGVTGIAYCCSATGACGITGGCENAWPNYDYYTLFFQACPNCLITNCDMLNYHCTSANGRLSQYNISFTN